MKIFSNNLKSTFNRFVHKSFTSLRSHLGIIELSVITFKPKFTSTYVEFNLDNNTIRLKRDVSKQDILNLYMFSAKYGVKWGSDWKLDPENNIIITPDGIKFLIDGFDTLIFAETFLYDIHFIDFDLTGRTVITAGAYVGDTPLYFAKKGAKVYAFEPQASCFSIAKRNLELNPDLSKNIVLENYAIGIDGSVEFPDTPCSGGASISMKNVNKSTVRSISISNIVKEYGVEPDILDLDIKGEEFTVIKDKILNRFNVVRIEYNRIEGLEDRNTIINKLKEYGFSKIRVYKHNELKLSLLDHGTILAVK